MTPIEYLKRQAKNLLKDFQTQTSSFDPKLQRTVYAYDPRFFKIDLLVDHFGINEEKFKLGNAQHVIAKLCGLEKWQELLKASPAKIELSVLLYTNMDKLEIRDWDEYISDIRNADKVELDDEFKLQIFKEGFLEWQQVVTYDDYRLSNEEEDEIEWERLEPESESTGVKITSLPLTGAERNELTEEAEVSFDRIFDRVEPNHPELTRSLWDAERFIDRDLLNPDMLPIDRNYALSLVDALLVGYIIQLAVQADEQSRDPD